MSLPANCFTTTCDIYRPFGAGSATTTGVPCRLMPDLAAGRGAGSGALVSWTDYIDVADTVDVRDGCTRTAGADAVTFHDGDEVRIPNGSGSRFVVVWVERVNLGTAQAFQRAYLLRDTFAVTPAP